MLLLTGKERILPMHIRPEGGKSLKYRILDWFFFSLSKLTELSQNYFSSVKIYILQITNLEQSVPKLGQTTLLVIYFCFTDRHSLSKMMNKVNASSFDISYTDEMKCIKFEIKFNLNTDFEQISFDFAYPSYSGKCMHWYPNSAAVSTYGSVPKSVSQQLVWSPSV